MKRILKKKVISMSLLMGVCLFTPIISCAQGLFGRGSTPDEESKDESLFTVWRGTGMEWNNGGMTPQDPTQEAPLGSGAIILIAASSVYSILKTKDGKEKK